jgi:hypothetical protein
MRSDSTHLTGFAARSRKGDPFRLSLASCCCLLLALAPATISSASQNGKFVISTEEETTQDMALVPCKDKERLAATKALFVKLGAREDEVSIEKHDGVENLVLRKAGKSQGTIVIGAHYDKVSEGCGAIDNWTGIVTLAHIFRSLKDAPLDKSLIFVAFGKEEKGLLGSKAMVRAIKKEEVDQYCAMVNIDSLGMAAPQTPVNLSSSTLVSRVVDLAQRMKIPFNKVSINGSADSVSYIGRKIPAITISAVADGWEKVLHSDKDRLPSVNQTSVYLGYRVALSLVVELSGLPCEVSRKDSTKK